MSEVFVVLNAGEPFRSLRVFVSAEDSIAAVLEKRRKTESLTCFTLGYDSEQNMLDTLAIRREVVRRYNKGSTTELPKEEFHLTWDRSFDERLVAETAKLFTRAEVHYVRLWWGDSHTAWDQIAKVLLEAK